MSVPVSQLGGMTSELAAKLLEQDIKTSDQLLDAVKTVDQRKLMSKSLGIDMKELLYAANRADLARVKGIGSVFADLLEHSGVDTVVELGGRVPANLLAKLTQVNKTTQLAGRLPTASQVENWIAQAKALPRGIEY